MTDRPYDHNAEPIDHHVYGPMTREDILRLARTTWRRGHRWQRIAADLVQDPLRVHFIPNRKDDNVYLVRMWLTTPHVIYDGTQRILDSSDSWLLHFFAAGDDDACLHDHPWDFETEIVDGGYREHLPPLDWLPGSPLGPAWNQRHVWRDVGDRVQHRAADLHCVGLIKQGTMTLVRTGPKARSWFFHPPGEVAVPWREFLYGPQGRKTDRIAKPAATAHAPA